MGAPIEGASPEKTAVEEAGAGVIVAEGGAARGTGGGEPPIGEVLVEAAPGPEPLGVVRTPTGNAGVDAALDRLADADELATAEHLEVYEDAHRRMRDPLEELDRRPGPQGPGGP